MLIFESFFIQIKNIEYFNCLTKLTKKVEDLIMLKMVCNVIGFQGLQEIEITNSSLKSIKTSTESHGHAWISQGGIDIQINGALGLAFPEVQSKDIETIKKIGYFLWDQGIDGYLPTIVTTSIDKIHNALGVFEEVIHWQKNSLFTGAKILGIHLEGPFLNPEKKGAHPKEHLLPLSNQKLEIVLDKFANIIKVITLAPELEQNNQVIPYLKSLGIIVSLGHSQATDEEAKVAFAQGASMVTHAYNAMPPLNHRQPGLLAQAILNKSVYCGVIADGIHVCPSMIDILLRASDYDHGVFLVSDALAPLGLEDGIYPWDDRYIEIKSGTARLADGVLSGTTVPLLQGVQNLIDWGICSIPIGISLATRAPRIALGMPHQIKEGDYSSNLLYWQEKDGKLIWQRISDTLS